MQRDIEPKQQKLGIGMSLCRQNTLYKGYPNIFIIFLLRNNSYFNMREWGYLCTKSLYIVSCMYTTISTQSFLFCERFLYKIRMH